MINSYWKLKKNYQSYNYWKKVTQLFMSQPIHLGTVCADCHLRDIRGLCYKCAHCVNYTLCSMCFPYKKHHPLEHLFLVLERPYLGNSTEPLLPQPTFFSSFGLSRQASPPRSLSLYKESSSFNDFASLTEMSMDVQPTPIFGAFCHTK